MFHKQIFKKDFTLVAIGQIISLFGNQILRYALPLYLLNKTGSSALFGTIMACSFIPMLLLYPIGGVIADRVNKRNIMVALDMCTAVLIFLFYIFYNQINIVILMGIMMIILYGIQGAYQPAVQASVPVLVDKKYIIEANSIVNLISSAANMSGPIIGGILLSMLGLTPILYISMICFFMAAIMEIFIHIPYKKQKRDKHILQIGVSDIKESFLFMFKKQPVLWKISLIFASVNLLLTSLILIALPVLITQGLGFQIDYANRLYGYSQGVIAFGAIIGGLLAGTFSKKLTLSIGPMLLLGCAISILLCGFALQCLQNTMAIYIVLVAGATLLIILSTMLQIQIMSYIQMITPHEVIGKVISCVICVCMCTNPIGQFVYGMVFDNIHIAVYIPFYIASGIMIIIGIASRKFFLNASIIP